MVSGGRTRVMPTTSAPGKVYLFGEHAVVYGEPAVPCAIERRASVTAERRDGPTTRIEAPAVGLEGVTVELDADEPRLDVDPDRARHAVRYVLAAIEAAREATADADPTGIDVRIESDLPIGAGLGSSAAVTVATVDAVARALGTTLEPAAVADAGYRVERSVQGSASRADTFCAVMGGAVRVEGDDCRRIGEPGLDFVVGYDGGSGETGELVAGVRDLRERYGFAAGTVAAIGDLVRAGEAALDDGALEELGRLMDVNHGLLSALGVSGRSLDAMVWTAREAGALGAKLTGAGGAGCIVALDPDGASVVALRHLPGCESAFRAGLDATGLDRR